MPGGKYVGHNKKPIPRSFAIRLELTEEQLEKMIQQGYELGFLKQEPRRGCSELEKRKCAKFVIDRWLNSL